MLNGLDLFSGYGGIARALSPWVRTVAYCEVVEYRQGVLLSEMQRCRIDRAPIWDDVRTLRAEHIKIPIDIITGGWPCTGHSRAGHRAGLDNVESSLAKELIRLVCEFRPKFCFLENVPGVLDTGLDEISAQFATHGYVGRYGPLSCFDVATNAWHQRERIWIALTDSRSIGSNKGGKKQIKVRGLENSWDHDIYGTSWSITNTYSERLEGWIKSEEAWPALPFVTAAPNADWPEGVPEPTLFGKDDGPAEWRSQIELAGGGVVPQVAREAFKRLFGLDAAQERLLTMTTTMTKK